jgi:flagellar basal body-associated protein FliL
MNDGLRASAHPTELEETVGVLKKHEWMIISAQTADNLKTREKKERLRSAMPDREAPIFKKMAGKNPVKEVFFTLFVTQ